MGANPRCDNAPGSFQSTLGSCHRGIAHWINRRKIKRKRWPDNPITLIDDVTWQHTGNWTGRLQLIPSCPPCIWETNYRSWPKERVTCDAMPNHSPFLRSARTCNCTRKRIGRPASHVTPPHRPSIERGSTTGLLQESLAMFQLSKSREVPSDVVDMTYQILGSWYQSYAIGSRVPAGISAAPGS